MQETLLLVTLSEGRLMLALSLPGGGEWLVILIIALLLFGSRLPSVMRSLGKSVSEFKKGMREGEDDLKPPEEKPTKDDLAG